MKRNRIIYLGLIVFTIALGLLSRASFIPEFIYPYLGDYLYAVMIFFIVGFIFNRLDTVRVAIISIVICYGIETLQLYQSPWINEIRSTRLGALTLGSGFLWSDILSYTFGGLTGWIMEVRFLQKSRQITS